MEFQRVKRSGPFSITLQIQNDALTPDSGGDPDPDLDLDRPVTGEISVSLKRNSEFDYPLDFTFGAHGEYLSFDTVSRSVTDASEFPVVVQFETHAANTCDPVTIRTAGNWFSSELRIPSADIVMSYTGILSSLDENLVKNAIEEYYGTGLEYTDLRGKHPVSALLNYDQYLTVLNFLYEHGDYDSLPYTINEPRSVKKRVVDPDSAFRADSIRELTEKVEAYAAHEHLQSISVQDVIRETLFDAWNFDSWDEEHTDIPDIYSVDEFASHFELTQPLQDTLSDENIAHLISTYYVADQAETDTEFATQVTAGDLSGTIPPSEYDSQRDDAVWTSLGNPDTRISALSPLVPTAVNRGDDTVIAHFLYSLAYSIADEHQKNKICSAIYYGSSQLFERSDFSHKTPVGKEAVIRSYIQRGYPYKSSEPAQAFEYYDAATRVFQEYESDLNRSATGEFLHATEQALKAVIRQMRRTGDTQTAAEHVNQITGRISEAVEDFDTRGTVAKLRAWKQGIHAANAVNNGSFQQANSHLSQSITYFGTSQEENPRSPVGEDPVFTPLGAELQKTAVSGLLAESEGRFEDATELYADAANEAEEELDTPEVADKYRIWEHTTDVKAALASGNVDTAVETVSDIQNGGVNVALAELSKLEMLVTLLEEYRDGSARDQTDIRRAFETADVTVAPEKYTLQYDTKYSTGYSLLLSRQRSKQLNLDVGENKEFFRLIEDAITPTGLSEGRVTGAESASDGGIQSEDVSEHPGTSTSTDASIPSSVVGESPGAGGNSNETLPAQDVEREYTETARLQRDPEFLQTVRDAYNECCAVCGVRRETPDGRPEVEAAHIKSVSDGGPDTLENGLALCRLHHWAFDNGWLAIDDDFRVLVRNAPEKDGYAEFEEYAGDLVHVPDDPDAQPSLSFIRDHREKFGFE